MKDNEIMIYLNDKECGAYILTEEFSFKQSALGVVLTCIDKEGYINVIPQYSIDRIKYSKTANIVKVCDDERDNDNIDMSMMNKIKEKIKDRCKRWVR